MKLGSGYNSIFNDVRPSPFEDNITSTLDDDPHNEDSSHGNIGKKILIKKIEDSESFKQEFEATVKAKGQFHGISGGLGMHASKKTTESGKIVGYRIDIVVRDAQKIIFDTLTPNDEALKYLVKGKVADFYIRYGNEYVSKIKSGRNCSIFFQTTFKGLTNSSDIGEEVDLSLLEQRLNVNNSTSSLMEMMLFGIESDVNDFKVHTPRVINATSLYGMAFDFYNLDLSNNIVTEKTLHDYNDLLRNIQGKSYNSKKIPDTLLEDYQEITRSIRDLKSKIERLKVSIEAYQKIFHASKRKNDNIHSIVMNRIDAEFSGNLKTVEKLLKDLKDDPKDYTKIDETSSQIEAIFYNWESSGFLLKMGKYFLIKKINSSESFQLPALSNNVQYSYLLLFSACPEANESAIVRQASTINGFETLAIPLTTWWLEWSQQLNIRLELVKMKKSIFGSDKTIIADISHPREQTLASHKNDNQYRLRISGESYRASFPSYVISVYGVRDIDPASDYVQRIQALSMQMNVTLSSTSNNSVYTLPSSSSATSVTDNLQSQQQSLAGLRQQQESIVNTMVPHPTVHFSYKRSAHRPAYPAQLADAGVSQTKTSGPRVTDALVEMAQKSGSIDNVLDVADKFHQWSSYHNRNFNFSPKKVQQDIVDARTKKRN